MTATKHFIENFEPFRAVLFLQRKVIPSCANLVPVIQLDPGNKLHRIDFLGDFRTCLLPEIVRDNSLQTWYPISS
jgi:hypothetical protein